MGKRGKQAVRLAAVCGETVTCFSSVRRLFAERLRAWRMLNRLPLKTVARDLGVGISTVSDWERGNRFPSAEMLDAIGMHMGQPPCRLICVVPENCDAGLVERGWAIPLKAETNRVRPPSNNTRV